MFYVSLYDLSKTALCTGLPHSNKITLDYFPAQISIRRFNDKEIAHEHIAVKPIAKLLLCFEKVFLELVLITLSEKDPPPQITSRDDMI